MRYCSRCVYPSATAYPMTFTDGGVCSGCIVADQKRTIDWSKTWDHFKKIMYSYRSSGDYDCVIGVSGGKDSYYQTHVVVKELGLKPLLVTYHGNNYLPEGEYNLQRMREVFDCDHLIIRPSESVLIKMNRLGFRIQGDMNWHAHCGINTVPMQVAVRYNIPLVLWGEHGQLDLVGMYSLTDQVEFTARNRKEHDLRGYDPSDFTDEGLSKLGHEIWKEGLTMKDLRWTEYPSDEELERVGVRGLYLGNFVDWDANRHAKLVMDLYGWRSAQQPFERTYRNFSNVDDMHENGIHDYLKFVKFGYGRASDHASKDIRSGYLTREQGVEFVRRYDHVKPRRDLDRWLRYVGMSEEEFDRISDGFRDPRVWSVRDGKWVKDTLWGEVTEYGEVTENSSKA